MRQKYVLGANAVLIADADDPNHGRQCCTPHLLTRSCSIDYSTEAAGFSVLRRYSLSRSAQIEVEYAKQLPALAVS